MSVIDGIGAMGGGAIPKSIGNRVSWLDPLDDGLEPAAALSVRRVLDHLLAQLGGNSGLAQYGVRQSFRIDLGINGLDLGYQLGAGLDQCVDVDLGGLLGVSEFGLQLADFLVFGGDGGGEFSLGVGQSLCHFLLEPLNFGGVFHEYLDGLIAQNYR